jgi:starvation-inducible DNA-binding protein
MAGSRHSAADVALIKAARKAVLEHANATAAYTENMKNMFVELGDDMTDDEQVNSRQAESDAVRSVKAADLPGQMREILGATVCMWYKASAAHWNIEGDNFPQYHAFFGELYEALEAGIDPTAEYIRALGFKTPATIYALLATQPVDTMTEEASLPEMLASITLENMRMLDLLQGGIYFAGIAGEFAVQNFLQDRLGYHQKLRWMLRAIQTPTQEMPEAAEPDEMEEPGEMLEEMAETAAMPMEQPKHVKELASQLLYVLRGNQ